MSGASTTGPADGAGLSKEWWLRLGHDLRGPIAPMRMAVQMLRSTRLEPPAQDEALQLIDRQIDLLLASIDDVADLLRLEHGRFQFNAADAELGLALDLLQGRSSLQRFLLDRQQSLQCTWPEAPVSARYDTLRLVSLLEHLVRKLSIHAPTGSVLGAGIHPHAGGVRISLTGGNPPADDEEIAFVLGAAGRSAEFEAKAILMREIVRRHGITRTLTGAQTGICLELPVSPD